MVGLCVLELNTTNKEHFFLLQARRTAFLPAFFEEPPVKILKTGILSIPTGESLKNSWRSLLGKTVNSPVESCLNKPGSAIMSHAGIKPAPGIVHMKSISPWISVFCLVQFDHLIDLLDFGIRCLQRFFVFISHNLRKISKENLPFFRHLRLYFSEWDIYYIENTPPWMINSF